MRIVAWNLNHRIHPKPITPAVVEALLALKPHWLILTEYVEHDSHVSFFNCLADSGIRHKLVSHFVARNNRVVVASRSEIIPGANRAPAIAEAIPSNFLHVTSPSGDIDVVGIRLPDYSKQPAIRRAWWDWFETTATSLVERPTIIAGDFNTDAGYSKARCGDRLERLVRAGWQHAVPATGSSYWTLNGLGKRIDHAFVSRHFRILDSQYVTEAAGYQLVGKPAVALSDHAAVVVDIERIG